MACVGREPGDDDWDELKPVSEVSAEARLLLLTSRVDAQQDEEEAWETVEIAVKDGDPSRKGQFSRVLGVDYKAGTVTFPPRTGSPSQVLKTNVAQLRIGIKSSMRIHATRGLGSGSALSGRLVLTNEHVVGGYSFHRCMARGMAPAESFDSPVRARYHVSVVDKDATSDLALLEISSVARSNFTLPANPRTLTRFDEYLLPCSPSSNDKVGIVSFPNTTRFLFAAREELVDGTSSTMGVWDTYRNAMRDELSEARGVLRTQCPGRDEAAVNSLAEEQVKLLLFKLLHETFGHYSAGAMTVSVGTTSHLRGGEAETTCSTLKGSSGGPLCLLDRPGYFCGVHRGAAAGNEANLATTCDHPRFVQMYFKYVLSDLPSPKDAYWQDRELYPFFQWLMKHAAEFPGDAQQSAWFQAAREATLKRKMTEAPAEPSPIFNKLFS